MRNFKTKNNIFKRLVIFAIATVLIGSSVTVSSISITSDTMDKKNIEVTTSFDDDPSGIKEPMVSADFPDDCPSGMISYWKLDETSGTTAYDCYGSNDGTNNGATINQSGQEGTAYYFDGDDYIQVPDDTSLHLSSFTVMVWARATDRFGNWRSIITKDQPGSGGSEFWFGFGSNNKLDLKFNAGPDRYGITAIVDSNWHFLVGVYDGTYISLYLDGVSDNTPVSNGPMTVGTGTLNMGVTRFWGDNFFIGDLDEVAIYNIALTSSEIKNLYYKGLNSHGYCDCPDTVYVDDDYTSTDCGGHIWSWDAFDNIQEGIDAVCGSTVYVAAGTYSEEVEFDNTKNDITLNGANAGTPGTGSRDSESIIDINENDKFAIDILDGADGVVIDGFTLKAGDDIVNVRSDNVVIKNNIVTPSASPVTTNSPGIFACECDNLIVSYNWVYDIGLSGSGCGMFLGLASYSADITNSLIEHNLIENSGGAGILLNYASVGSSNTVEYNEIKNVGHDGIRAGGQAHDVTIQYNEIYGSARDGVRIVTDAASHHINYNSIYSSVAYGLNNLDAATVDAECNWWGNCSGPTHASNPSGTGDVVSDNVDFDPWTGKVVADVNGPYSSVDGTPVQFDSSGSTSCCGDTPLYSWDFDDGVISPLENPTHTYTSIGIYTVTLTVEGSVSHCTDVDTATVTVTSTVVSDADGPYEGTVGIPVDFTGSASGGAPPYQYYWSFGDNTYSPEQNPSYTYDAPGIYPVSLKVTDDIKGTDTNSTYVLINPAEELVADADGPYAGDVDEVIQFHGSAVGGTQPYSWYWEFGDGDTSTLQNPTHSYDTLGEYTATLTVTDTYVKTDDDTANVLIGGYPPNKPTITGQISGKIGTEYEYTFNAIDPDGDNVKYHINWGDSTSNTTAFSSSGTDAKVKHTWSTAGNYTIKATAEDTNGLVGPEGTLLVSMPRNRATQTIFLQFLENLMQRFPLLAKLIQQYPILYQLLQRVLRL